jgi:hypothetical protein
MSTKWLFEALHPHALDGVGLVALLEQLGVRPRVAGVGIHGARRGFADREVIGVTEVHAIPVAVAGLAHHQVGTHVADDPADVAS